jgi:hypothetical protein
VLAPALAAVDRSLDWVTPAMTGPRVVHEIFRSAAAEGPVSYHLYVPAAYREDPQRRFPVVYWLHGSGGGLPGIAPLARQFEAAIAAGRVPPCLVVFVNGMRNGMYVDWKDGSAPLETVIIRDLIPHLDATYRFRPARPDLEARAIDRLELGPLMARRTGQLSTGEAQRVALLRALTACQGLLLLDEPVTALPPELARRAVELIAALTDEQGWTAIVVSHQPLEGLPAAMRLEMADGLLQTA